MSVEPPPPLGAEARSLLEAARGSTGPDAATLARMKAGIGVKVAAGAGGAALGMKLGIVAALAGAVIVGAFALKSWQANEARAFAIDASIPMPSPVEVVAAPSVASAEPDVAPLAAEPARGAATVEPTRSDDSRDSRTVSDATRADRVAPPEKPERRRADLTREVELIDTAMDALRRGDAKAALAAVRTHALETSGSGQLAEDAAAIAIEAHCLDGTGDRDALLTAFDRKWPRSSQRARIAAACAR
jgi:hypothetical protein